MSALFPFLFLSGSFFGNAVTECAKFFSKQKIFTVRVGHKTCPVQMKFTAIINSVCIYSDGDNVGEDHMMAAQRQNLSDAAFDIDGTLCDAGHGDLTRCLWCQTKLPKFIDIPAGADAAVIGGAH